MKIKLVIPPERTDKLMSLLYNDYKDFDIRRDNNDVIVSSDKLLFNNNNKDEIWNLNLELMDKYKITGTIIDYN